ncbi:MAG: hypothetical protein LBD21_03060 [Tannerellaceae bacterium]|jgi:hypothetical protein|nr:hypothetical protein [Tannerellaceae bacterium]
MKNVILRRWLTVLTTVLATTFVSCEKDVDETKEDTPGQIAGLGETAGEPTGTSFKLPEGIELADKIMGGYRASNYRSATAFDKQAAMNSLSRQRTWTIQTRAGDETIQLDTILGSGYFVEIFMPLRNSTSRVVTVTFPAGLIAESVSGRCQNGVLLKKATVQIPVGRIYGVLLKMYCGNAHRDPSYSSEEYVFTVVSNSSLIMDLCNRVKNKRINNEEYPLGSDGHAKSSQYDSYVSKLQSILWNLTDYGAALSESSIAEIEAMENS